MISNPSHEKNPFFVICFALLTPEKDYFLESVTELIWNEKMIFAESIQKKNLFSNLIKG